MSFSTIGLSEVQILLGTLKSDLNNDLSDNYFFCLKLKKNYFIFSAKLFCKKKFFDFFKKNENKKKKIQSIS